MTEYRFDDVIVAADASDLPQYLAEFHGGKIRPLCLCQPDGVPMYIAKLGEHYIIKRMPNSGSAHAPECPAYEPPAELSGLGEVKGQAIQEDAESGVTTLRLDFSLKTQAGRKAPAPSGQESDTVRTDGAKLTLRGVLHYLWDEAGLTRWYPAMEGKRNWYVVRKYLMQAAFAKEAKQVPLHQSLYIPETFASDREAEITQRRIAKMATLAAPGRTRPLMIAIGEVKEIALARYGYKLVVKHLPGFPFMLDEQLHDRMEKRFANALALWNGMDDAHLVFIGTFGLGPTGIASLVELSLMTVTANWLPFEHAYDKLLLDALGVQQRRFVKGLRYNMADSRPIATAVLTDAAEPVALYVKAPELPDEQAAALAMLIGESEMTSWVWSADEAMPALPAMAAKAARPAPRSTPTAAPLTEPDPGPGPDDFLSAWEPA